MKLPQLQFWHVYLFPTFCSILVKNEKKKGNETNKNMAFTNGYEYYVL